MKRGEKGIKGSERGDLEPLDKGRLSLGDVGDTFRAQRGKKGHKGDI